MKKGILAARINDTKQVEDYALLRCTCLRCGDKEATFKTEIREEYIFFTCKKCGEIAYEWSDKDNLGTIKNLRIEEMPD